MIKHTNKNIVIKKLAVIMSLICTVAVLGGCAAKGKGNVDSTTSLAPIKVPDSIAVSKLDPSGEWVYDSEEFEGTPHRVPQFNVDSQGIAEINEKIVKNCKELANSGNKRNISYTYIVKKFLISVYIEIIEDGWFYKSYAYNISLGDGSLVDDARTMAAYCGISDEDYRIAAATAVTNEYAPLYASFSDSHREAYYTNLEKNQSDKMTKTYKGYINKRSELCFCGQMYGLDGSLRYFSATSVIDSGMN